MTPTVHPDLSDGTCGCEGFKSSRRGFLGGVAALAGAGVVTTMYGTTFARTAYAATGSAANVVVVVSMRGGADGMSLVVPHAETAYYKARPTVGIPKAELLQADDTFGLHPNFQPLQQMWIDKKFAAVHAVGLGSPNRSHFAAMELIEDADPGSSERSGWLNRLIALDGDRTPFEAVHLGSAIVPTSMFGTEPTLAVIDLKDLALAGPQDPAGELRRRDSLTAAWSADRGMLGDAAREAMQVSQQFEDVPKPGDPQNGAVYPTTDLGSAMADTANLIRANLGAEIVTIDSGNWDLHAGMGTLSYGLMKGLITDLAGSLAAFFQDLGEAASNVTVVTISEFGRRLGENAAKGLDHGYGNVMLLLGAGVNGGKYYANWPGLALDELKDGDLMVTRDYRSVLAEVVQTRFDADVSKVFPDFTPEPIGAMRAG